MRIRSSILVLWALLSMGSGNLAMAQATSRTTEPRGRPPQQPSRDIWDCVGDGICWLSDNVVKPLDNHITGGAASRLGENAGQGISVIRGEAKGGLRPDADNMQDALVTLGTTLAWAGPHIRPFAPVRPVAGGAGAASTAIEGSGEILTLPRKPTPPAPVTPSGGAVNGIPAPLQLTPQAPHVPLSPGTQAPLLGVSGKRAGALPGPRR